MTHTLLKLVLLCFFISCRTTDISIQPEFYKEDSSINLYAFIGKKISVEKIKMDSNEKEIFIGLNGDTVVQDVLYFNEGFTAKYKVVKPMFNSLKHDTITFLASDHFGHPKFANHEYVILYLLKSEENNKFYHYKYIYDPVKKNINGTWSGFKEESVADIFEKRKNDVFKALFK